MSSFSGRRCSLLLYAAIFAGLVLLWNVLAYNSSFDPFSSKPAEISDSAKGPQEPGIGVDELLSKMDRLDGDLQEMESRKESLRHEVSGSEREILDIEQGLQRLMKDKEIQVESARARLLTLYKFRQIGYAIPLLSSGEPHSLSEAERIAEELFRSDSRVFLEFSRVYSEISSIEASLSQKRKQLAHLKASLDDTERELGIVRGEKLRLLDLVGRREEIYARYSARIEQDQKALEKRVLNRKPVFDFQWMSFSARRGDLPLPTEGQIIETYGSKIDASFQTILYNSGVVINAPKGQPIRAVHEGLVVFADWFKEYGKVMIVDHGDHYYTLIAHADELFKKSGDVVRGGDVVATVGNSGSLDGPKLYFEIRRYGKPVDPMEWLAFGKSLRE